MHDPTHPLHESLSVRAGREAYFAANGFSAEVYDATWTPATLLGLRFAVPNTARHRWAIMWHDLHHVATGFGTDFTGEAEISAWECRRGLRPLGLYTGAIVLSLAVAGLFVSPRRVLRAWHYAPARRSLFHESGKIEEFLDTSVAELREHLSLPPGGIAAPSG